uniref:Striated muscle enriched protein kinase b n=1 Tax=Oryzias latipes TaxID=8090 RepID=A0A3P9JTH3_ORYLA
MTMPDDDQHMLKLLKVKSTDVGEMTFVASNEYGSDSCTFIVEMAAPPTFETIMEDLDVCAGETPRFAVVVEGKPIPDILWFKGDDLLSESSHYTFVYDDNECSLVILNAHPEDSGVYTCTARNLAGSVSCKAELTVHEAKHKEDSMEDEESILRKMRRLTDYYDIHKEIGRGAFSYVKRVTHKGSKMEYVAKFISTRAKKKTSSLREMNLLSRLDHERIIYFHDAFEKKNAVIIITEKCHEELLDRFTRKSAILESDVRSCIRQLLEGLGYLHHQNIIHLDIKPENVLMADPHSDQIRICDFGNAVEIKPDEVQYCKYGTPEFVAPEIVNQSPISKATDIWPVGVIAYLCLTGISPFAGENDRSSVLNIRNYNVAFEESMFADLCRESKGFIIKLLVADRLRPDSQACLRHPWFKMLSKGKAISTEALKKFVSRRKWQRSIISYKSKMVMRSIPELLNDSSSHVSIAVPRHLRESSALPSSSSDSDEDIDELPFIPMPVNMEFSRSWMSLNDIQSNEGEAGKQDGTIKRSESSVQAHDVMECDSEVPGTKSVEVSCKDTLWKRQSQEKDDLSSNHERLADLPEKQSRKPLKRGSSVESDKAEGGRRKGELRRGGSADSALLLRIPAEEGIEEENREDGRRVLKKAVSMELPRRSTSPGTAKMSQEDYALKLELMRQRLLRGGSVDNKMSGLRGPLLETLGLGDEKRVVSSRTARLGPPPLTRAASSDFPRDDVPKPKILRKSTSFSQGDSEPIHSHRRSGAPLEIPVTQAEERKLKEAISMSALTEQIKLDSRPVTPREPSPKPPSPESVVRESPTKTESDEYLMEKEIKTDETINEKMDGLTTESNFDERSSTSGFSERDMSISEEPINESEYVGPRMPTPPPVGQGVEPVEKMDEMEEGEKKQEIEEGLGKDGAERNKNVDSSHEGTTKAAVEDLENRMDMPVKMAGISITTSSVFVRPTQEYVYGPGHIASTHVTPSIPARVVLPDGRMSAYASIMQTIMVPALPSANEQTSVPPVAPSTTLSPVSPEASAQVSESSHHPVILSTTEHPAVYSRVASPDVLLKEPTPPKTSTQSSSQQEISAGAGFQDITSEEVFEARFKKRESSLSRSLKFLSRSKNDDKSQPVPPDSVETHEEIYRPGPVGAPLEFAQRRLEEKSKSVQDLREAQKDQGFMRRLSMRLKRTPSTERKDDPSKADDSAASSRRLSWTLGRRGSQEKKEGDMMQTDDQDQKELKKPSESPVLAMRRKIESTVAGLSTRIRSFSEERRTSEEKESKRTPILSMLRRSTSESRAMKVPLVPQNQLASQAQNGASSESLDSMSSLKSETSKGLEGERRSRWDRWGLTRSRRDKTVSQPDIPTAIYTDSSAARSHQYSRLASDFPPVFHIKLRDHVLLEGDPVTLSCLPAGSPHPHISWQKDKKPLEIDARMNMISCPDGRQLLMIMQTTKKDAGVYECVATNPLASVSSSCTISLARLPNRPGTPEIPQKYNNTALVLWRPSDTMAPCTYSLERKSEGDNNWLIVATGVADCYYNVADLPAGGSFRFRVACVNKAGQGPYSNLSEVVHLDSFEPAKTSSSVVVKTVPAGTSAPPVVMMSSMTVPPMKPAPPKSTTVTNIQPVPPSMPAPTISVSQPTSPLTIKPAVQVAVSRPAVTLSVSTISTQQAPVQTPPKAKTTISISVSKPHLKPPPVVPPKPQSPIHAFPSVTHSPPSPEPSPVPAIGKPISSLPMYVPTASAHLTAPLPAVSATTPATTAPAVTPVTTPPPVVVVQSLTPVMLGGDSRSPSSGRVTPTGRVTPSGRRTPLGKPGEGALRQGVPQKPYTFMDEKARGRFGVIRECRENATGNLFLAKIVPYEADSKQAVLQEYDILKSLHHDRIMALHEAYVTPRYLVLISEYCSGKELLYSLTERFRYSEDDVVTYIVQVLQGLDYLHTRRILHLDIKPENIIVTHMNIIKIIDFGSSQTYNPLFLKQFNPPIGTLEYMSPEMLKGDVVGPPADIWSLGVVTFIMLSGRLPFMEINPQETEAKILAAKLDLSKLYQNVSQSASLFLKKILCSYPWARPSIKDCFNNSWLQDAYLMRLRRQTLTFTTTLLKEFLAEQQHKREKEATKHKVLLRSYQSSPQTLTSTITPTVPTAPSALVTQ